MQWDNATAGTDVNVLRNGGDSSAGNRRIRVGAAEGVKVSLRRPDGLEAVRVREFRAFDQQPILARTGTVIIAPVKQTEIHRPARPWTA